LLPLHDRERKTDNRYGIAGIAFLALIIAPRLVLAAEPAVGSSAAKSAAVTTKDGSVDPAKDPPSEPDRNAPIDTSRDAALDSSGDPVGDETLLLDVQVNGQPTGKVGEFLLRRGRLMARPTELRELGFRIPDSLIVGPHDFISLSDIRGLAWKLDQKNLELFITVTDNLLVPNLLHPDGQKAALEHREIESGTGLTLNYDAVGTFTGGAPSATGALDLRAFSPYGVASSGWLAYGGADQNKAVRLDSAYTFADVNSLRRYSLGDYINGSLAWTRPVHMEGVEVNSDFSMRPDLITFPMPTVSGSAAVPSTVEVLTDGSLAASSEVGAGPFQVPQLPVVSGAGTITMNVTNALGQQMTTTLPFYASTALLAPGLQTFAVQSGVVRRGWGSASYDYGKIAGSAVYRRGLTSKLTIEGTVEGTPGTIMAGAGGVRQIRNLGVVDFSVAANSGWGHSGLQYRVGAQRIGRVFSIGGSASFATRDFRDIAAMNGDGTLRKQVSGFASVYLRRYGSLGAAYAGIDQDAPPVQISATTPTGQRSHIVSANYSLQVRSAVIYASLFQNVGGSSGGSGVQVGFTIPLGRRASAGASWTSDGNGQFQSQKSAALVGEWGYNVYASAGNQNHAFGQMQYKSSVGLFTAGVDQNGEETTGRLEADGALSFADGKLFPSNRIYDSFAIVDTSPVTHVHVLQENRSVGKTDSSGRLLVPDMRSFDLNHIAIVPSDVPADVKMDTATREMRPQDRSGVIVKFPVKFSRAALLRLVDEAGMDLPLGSVATLKSTGTAYPVGYDGNAYIEDLAMHNDLAVERLDGKRCSVSFEYKAIAGDIPSIGPLRCLETSP
jgi:outer membrane usher protein